MADVLNKLNLAFQSLEIQGQVEEWEQERQQMFDVISTFWTTCKKEFTRFWTAAATGPVRFAVIDTAVEDLPEGFVGMIRNLIAPELAEPQQLISDPTKLLELFEMLYGFGAAGNVEQVLLLLTPPADDDGGDVLEGIADPAQAKHALATARCCALFAFAQAVILIYSDMAPGASS